MIRSILLVTAAILAAACVSCAVPPPTATGPKLFSATLSSPPPANTQCQFADINLGLITDLNYDPSTLTAPTAAQLSPLLPTSTEYTDLQTVFNAAPAFFKAQLCSLAGLYIISPGATYSTSWGFRDANLHRYIGISDALWLVSGSNKALITLTYYLNNFVLPALLHGIDVMPQYTNAANPNTGAMTLAAALAHEVGHVLWNDFLVPNNFGGNPNFTNFCPGIFPTASWSTSTPINQASWRRLGDVANDPNVILDQSDPTPGTNDPSPQELKILTLKNLISQGKFKKARNIIARMLASRRPWPSLFGAFSANEDFVETYALYVLMQQGLGLTSLPLQVQLGDGSSTSIDIPGTIGGRALLTAKLLCFDDYLWRNPP
jgi:hypothetical protein